MKPALIIGNEATGYIAYNEDGRRVAGSAMLGTLTHYLACRGYEVVPHNSRIGRTILDKVNNHIL